VLFLNGSRLGIYFFVKREPNGLRPYYYYNVLIPLAVRKHSDGAARGGGVSVSQVARRPGRPTFGQARKMVGVHATLRRYSQQLIQRILFYYNIYSIAHVITTRHYDYNNINVVVRFPADGPRRSGTC
jgi:hypothetical protein